jgi:hypothetical protein
MIEQWNEERYRELNTYFKIRVEQLLQQNENLRAQVANRNDLQLSDFVAHMTEHDQERWDEFIQLDKLKFEIDMWNHLNGKGTPYQPGIGFNSPGDTSW